MTQQAAANVPARGNVTRGVDRVLSMPRASVYNNSGPITTTGVSAIIAWDSREYDSDGMWSTSSNTRLTSRTAGVYRLTVWGEWAASAVGVRQIYLRLNGAGFLVGDYRDAASSATTDQSCSRDLSLDSGDYVEVSAAQSSGGSLQFNGATLTNRVNGFQACLISTIP